MDTETGVVALARPLDRETTPTITVMVAATDQGLGNNQALVSSYPRQLVGRLSVFQSHVQATIVINVTDSNDNRPVFSIPPGGYVASILENVTVGSEVITVAATDLDQGANQVITYSILTNLTEGSVPFSIPDPTVSKIIASKH